MQTQPPEGEDGLTLAIAGAASAIESTVTAESREEARIANRMLQMSLTLEEQKVKISELKHRSKMVKDNRRMRKDYARRALNLAELAFVFWIIVFAVAAVGNLATGNPPFSDKALMTFTAGATVNVFVAFVGIIKGLFPVNAKS